jgi:membrane protein insertase Oxa1/YidC/SpoIIIJ
MWDAVREFLGAVVSFFYGLVPNLGVAIILLTVAVGLVLFPLTLKQTRSMRGMQLLAPELKRLQKEYAGDKPGLQQATLALYKERGINPAAGCLPMLLQMPVWFALYQVLQSFVATPLSLNDSCAGPGSGRGLLHLLVPGLRAGRDQRPTEHGDGPGPQRRQPGGEPG